MNLSDIALNFTLISMLAVAAAAIWSNRGYSFDLRNKAGNRRRDPNRQGGRRTSDSRLTA
jgi:hypothetical protein